MTERHERVRQWIGAYVLGALAPGERAALEDHLRDCPSCREELAALGALPGLLARLRSEEVEAGGDMLLDTQLAGATAAVTRHRRAARRRELGWRALAAAALVVALAVVFLPAREPRRGDELAPRPVVADAASVAGTAWIDGRAWGTAIVLDLQGLPQRRGYVLWAVADDGHRVQAASWSPTGRAGARLEGACYLPRDRLERLEVTSSDDELLFTLEARSPD